jgi:hypothetical protein
MQRREERQSVSRPARIELGDGSVFQCRIANVSRGGALLLVPESELLPAIFHVVDLFSDTRREVRNVWISPGRVGVSYIDIGDGHFGKPVRKQLGFGKRGA